MALRIFIIGIFILIIYPICAIAQSSEETYAQEEVKPHEFSKTDWQRAKQGIDYSADRLKTPKKEEKDKKKNNKSFFQGGNASGIMKFIIIIIGAVVLLLLIRSLLGLNNPKNKKIGKKITVVDLQQIEENIHDADIEDFIRQAIIQQDFALAVRLYYLAILKELSLKNMIFWKKDKTNKDYLREMRSSSLFNPFRETTAIFERIWYGGSPVRIADFYQLEPKFQAMMRQINSISSPTIK
ncbi:MAG: DUF4129 domain-containing protein [Saprospiraceae bacterium]|nr:DUF4129 domain-containing protein [Saprospiraceae bacterium]